MLDFHRHVRRLSGRSAPFATEPALEVIYRDLFLRELARLGEEDRYFPTGGAASYGLLYLILRIGIELQPRTVLDIGAGQSTLLWSMLHRRGLVGEVTTLEHDVDWGERIGRQVSHRVVVTPLRQARVGGITLQTYDWSAVIGRAPFEAVVCDGPIGTRRHSRCGLLPMLDEMLTPDFALIFDDAERTGEQDTVAATHRWLQARGDDYRVGIVRAAKTQAVFAAGRFTPAAFM